MKKFLIAKLVSLLLIGHAYAIQRPSEEQTVPTPIQQVGQREGCGHTKASTLPLQPQEQIPDLSLPSDSTFEDWVLPQSQAILSTDCDAVSLLRDGSGEGNRPTGQPSRLHVQEQRAVLRSVQSNETDTLGAGVPSPSEADILAKISRLAHAIARTEGFYVHGTLPNRLHNPGDIRSRLKHAYEGQIGLYHGYVVFRDDQFGWAALYQQIRKVLDDDSAFYNREMTFAQIAKVYATSPNWPKTLCKILKIDPRLTFDEYMRGNRNVNTTMQTGTPDNPSKHVYTSQQESPESREMLSEMYLGFPAWPEKQSAIYGELVTEEALWPDPSGEGIFTQSPERGLCQSCVRP